MPALSSSPAERGEGHGQHDARDALDEEQRPYDGDTAVTVGPELEVDHAGPSQKPGTGHGQRSDRPAGCR
jgi:hypothetical protein